MFYAITANSDGAITGSYHGPHPLPAPWIALTQAQFEAKVPGSAWSGSEMVPPAAPTAAELLAAARSEQILQLANACRKAIVGGFQSGALGAEYTYPSTPTDQANLLAAVAACGGAPAGWTTPLWCESAGGTWALAQHSAAQAGQVIADFRTMVAAAQVKLDALKNSVAGEMTVASVQAITW